MRTFFVVMIATLVFGATEVAMAQTVLGKTVKAAYTVTSCSKIGCLPAQNYSPPGVYVTSAGHVFDYSGSAQGTEFRLGVPQPVGGTVTAYIAQGNTLMIRSAVKANGPAGGGTVTTVYTIQGNTCTVSMLSTFKGISNRVTTNSCTVTDGNPNG